MDIEKSPSLIEKLNNYAKEKALSFKCIVYDGSSRREFLIDCSTVNEYGCHGIIQYYWRQRATEREIMPFILRHANFFSVKSLHHNLATLHKENLLPSEQDIALILKNNTGLFNKNNKNPIEQHILYSFLQNILSEEGLSKIAPFFAPSVLANPLQSNTVVPAQFVMVDHYDFVKNHISLHNVDQIYSFCPAPSLFLLHEEMQKQLGISMTINPRELQHPGTQNPQQVEILLVGVNSKDEADKFLAYVVEHLYDFVQEYNRQEYHHDIKDKMVENFILAYKLANQAPKVLSNKRSKL